MCGQACGLSGLKIIVCIKQVPHVSELRFDYQRKTLIREGVHTEINPFDRRAITLAAQLERRFGGESIVITMGPLQAKESLVEAMAMGVDRSIHLLDKAFAGSDTLATSRALAAAITSEIPVDLVLCGKYSVDAETGHVGPEVAELLNMPHVSGATKVEVGYELKQVMVEAETDYGQQRVATQLPLLITTAERLLQPYRATTEELEAAKTKPYRIVLASDLDPRSKFGFDGSPTYVSEIYPVETKRKCELIEGRTFEEKVQKLVSFLYADGLFRGWKDSRQNRGTAPQSRPISEGKAFWVIPELVQGRLRAVSFELLGKALELATKLERKLCVLVFGTAPSNQLDSLISYGADRVYLLKHTALSKYSSDAFASALAQTIQRFQPYAVLAASTSFGRDFMPRVAARLGLGMTSDCIGLELNDQNQLVQLKPAFGGNIVAPIISKTLPNMATVRPGVLTPTEPNPSRRGEIIEVEPNGLSPLSRVVDEEFRSDEDALRLDNAEVIVAAGAGVGGTQNLPTINQLAHVLDAPVATTRKVVDLGWLPSQLQIGLTGRSVGPKLYVAVGIRGAFNHMVGVGRAKIVVAINKDPNAPIFKNCDYGIVGDYAEIVPRLTEELRKAKQKQAPTQGGST
jgi:electron transfer flavoprotein alpha subunit